MVETMENSMGPEAIIRTLTAEAKNGNRITFHSFGAEKPTTLWAGLGNRAGLHSFAYELMAEKWKRSGERFVKKLTKALAGIEGGTIQVLEFRNISRDRGRWVPIARFTV